jgi:hypothetical protein
MRGVRLQSHQTLMRTRPTFVAAIVLTTAGAIRAFAQEPTDPAECRGTVEAFLQHRPGLDPLIWDRLPWCANREPLAAAVGIALHDIAATWPRDSASIRNATAGLIRHDLVFDSAYAVLGRLPPYPWLQRLLLAMLAQQRDPTSPRDLDKDGSCWLGFNSEYWGTPQPWPPLGPDRQARLEQLLTRVANQRSMPRSIRDYSRCIGRRAGMHVPFFSMPDEISVRVQCYPLRPPSHDPGSVFVSTSHPEGGGVFVVNALGRTWLDLYGDGGEQGVFLPATTETKLVTVTSDVIWHSVPSAPACPS